MKQIKIDISFEAYDSINELNIADSYLLQQAQIAAAQAYAPYSNFKVGACAELVNGAFVTGTNQENASYPVGICAERVLLAASSVLHPNVAIQTLAISYHNMRDGSENNVPISPCGMCRQALLEFEMRFQTPIRIILGGSTGAVYIITNVQQLLPLAFSKLEA